jgi:hypothetical protein
MYTGPNISKDGLVLYLDASNPKSYTSGSSIWYDISGNNNHFNLINSPVPTGSYIYFNGVNQRADCVNTTFGNFGIGSFTLEYVLYTNGAASNIYAAVIAKRFAATNIAAVGGNGWMDRIFANIFYTQDSNIGGLRANVLELGYTTPRDRIIQVNQVISKPTSLTANGFTYINNNLITTANRTYTGDGSVNNGNTVRLMFSDGEGGYLNGRLYSVKAYTRAFSASDVAQSFNATKGRFGL